MDGEEDRDQKNTERQAEDAAVPASWKGFFSRPQSDPKNEDDGNEIGDVESDASHISIHGTGGAENPRQSLINRTLLKAIYEGTFCW